MENLNFYINPTDETKTKIPCFILQYRQWDDFNRKTSFYLSYINQDQEREYLGLVKIGHIDEFEPLKILDKYYTELKDEFFSLCQSIQTYENLFSILGKDLFEKYLNAMNDMAFLDAIRNEFEYNSNFTSSLIRTSEAEKAFKEAKSKLYGLKISKNFIFTYKTNLQNTFGEHIVDFNFEDKKLLPNRIIALIGKNGTGKTQFLAQFALDLSGQSRNLLKEDVFQPHRPLFSKVIAISYSAFDKFTRPQKDKSFSYKYCGLKDEDGKLLTGPKIVENYKESVELILKQNRQNTWYKVMQTIIDDDLADMFYEEIFENQNYEIVNNKTSKKLSSGQSFLMYVITEVLAHIRENSILLFDEPEMHLHPNAIANFVRMQEILLERFDSYSIVATHSPIILQEIPSRYVNVFERQGNVPMIYKLGIESFGENIDVLTEQVFKTIEVEDNYKKILKELSKSNTYKKVLKLFDDKLSLNAKTYLLNQYENPEKEINA
ncbi:AAA family ATPase [Flavobacterium mekongense]|uniref:AAA family ATPase n=1 Tax=Flavobacterium mekongense TaxID=3379707 RepID=UPI00399B8AFF